MFAKIMTGVISGVILLFIQFRTDWFHPNEAEMLEKMNEVLIERVTAYYDDLEKGDFDANRYFASRVERFFQLKKTNPDAINANYDEYFKGEFLNVKYSLDFDNLHLIKEGNVYVAEFIVNCSFYLKSKRRTKAGSYMERIKLRKDGKFVYFHDFRILKESWK